MRGKGMSSRDRDAVVLGAGLMGRLLAWQLALRGYRVTVHEAGGADAACKE